MSFVRQLLAILAVVVLVGQKSSGSPLRFEFTDGGSPMFISLEKPMKVNPSPLSVYEPLGADQFGSLASIYSPLYLPGLEAVAANVSTLPPFVEDVDYPLPASLLRVASAGSDADVRMQISIVAGGTLGLAPGTLLQFPLGVRTNNGTLLDIVGPLQDLNADLVPNVVLTPSPDSSSPIHVAVTVSDQVDQVEEFSFSIQGVAVNDGPRANTTNYSNLTACEGTSIRYDIVDDINEIFYDVEGDTLSVVSVDTQPSEELYNSVQGRIVWNDIPVGFEGTYVFNITVTDVGSPPRVTWRALPLNVLSHTSSSCTFIPSPAKSESAFSVFVKDNAVSIFGSLGGLASLLLGFALVRYLSSRNRKASVKFLARFYEERQCPPRTHELVLNMTAVMKKRAGVEGAESMLLKLRRKGLIVWEGSEFILPNSDAFVEDTRFHIQRTRVHEALVKWMEQSKPWSLEDEWWTCESAQSLMDAPPLSSLGLSALELDIAFTTLKAMGLMEEDSDGRFSVRHVTGPQAHKRPGRNLRRVAPEPIHGTESESSSIEYSTDNSTYT